MIRCAALLFGAEETARRQREMLESHASAQEWTIIRRHRVAGGDSGRTERWAAFQELLAEARLGRFDTVLLAADAAAAEAPGEIGTLAAALRLQGVRALAVSSAGEAIPLDPGPQLEDLLRFAAEIQTGAESRARRLDRADRRRQRVLGGRWPGGRPPYGFRLADDPQPDLGRLEVDPAEASVVRDIFRLYIEQGLGSTKVAEELNRRGARLRSGGPWNDSAVRAVLRSPMVAGRPAYGRTQHARESGRAMRRTAEVTLSRIAVPEWEIVDFLSFQRAQERLGARRLRSAGPRGDRLLLSGLARCGHCGGPLTAGVAMPRRSLRDGTVQHYRYPRYDCRTRAGGGSCAGQRGYPAKRVETLVLARVPLALSRLREGELLHVVRQGLEESFWRRSLALERADRRVERAERAIRQLYGRPQRTPDAERLQSLARREAEAELVAARAEHRRLGQSLEPVGIQMSRVEEFLLAAENWWEKSLQSAEERRTAIRQLVGRVVMARSHVEIHWRVDLERLSEARDAGKLEWTERVAWPKSARGGLRAAE